MAARVAREKADLAAAVAGAAVVALVVGVAGAGADFPAETSGVAQGLRAFVGP